LPHVKSGKLKALAIASTQRSPQLPDMPTVGEAGLPGFEASTWFGVMVPAKTPLKVISGLHTAFTAALHAPEVRERLVAQGFEPIGSSPQEFARYIADETAKYAKIVRQAGIVPE